jgi:2-hydroxy-6-oxonona-2,4-dienedioate hydrolase
MGGVNAIRMAAEYPDRVSHLITMGSVMSRLPRLYGAGDGDGPTEGLKILVEADRNPTADTMQRLVEIMCYDKRSEAASAQPKHLENFLAGLPKGTPVPQMASLEQIMGIVAPSLLIHGRDDRVVHYKHSLTLVSYIPNSRLVLLNRCGHWAMIEHVDEFNRLVIDFVTHN